LLTQTHTQNIQQHTRNTHTTHTQPPPGLSAPEALIKLIADTPLGPRFAAARTHLRRDFESLAPVFETLLQAYGRYLKREWFGWDAFVWAAELFYAYASQVGDGGSFWVVVTALSGGMLLGGCGFFMS